MKIGIIVGSIRQGRISDRLAKWVENEVKKIDGIEATMIDLIDYPMPLFDEAVSPQYNPDRKVEGKVKAFLEVVAAQDGVIVVTPEYNRSYSSVLKNALDYIAFQLKRKPVLLVAHGSTGGAQAVSHLRAVFPSLLAVTSSTAVMVTGRIGLMFDEAGNPVDQSEQLQLQSSTLQRALDEFIWLSKTLAEGRAKDDQETGK